MEDRLVLSCDGCIMQNTAHCDDCLVTAVCNDSSAALDPAASKAVSLLQRGGLLPPLRRVVAR